MAAKSTGRPFLCGKLVQPDCHATFNLASSSVFVYSANPSRPSFTFVDEIEDVLLRLRNKQDACMTASPTPDSRPIPASGPSTTAGSAQELPPTLFRLKNLHSTSPPVTSPPVTEQSIQTALTHQAISAQRQDPQRQDPQRQDVAVAQTIRTGLP